LKITIVTPSYRQLHWLKLCVASVGDQQGVECEHIIQDAETGSDLIEWVKTHSRAKLVVESDSGMYDAINRGFRKATGDIVAWLNCDEQYLPGTLAKVAAYFEKHPKVDVLFGDAVLLSEEGELLSYRRAILPSLVHIKLAHLNTPSCATFVRRSVIERGFLLKTEWKTIADVVWVAELLEAKLRMAVLPEPLAAFTITKENLGQTSLALKEGERWQKQTTSAGLRALRGPVIFLHRVRKLLHGAYNVRNFATHVYTHSSGPHRVPMSAQKLSFAWIHSANQGSRSAPSKLVDILRDVLLPQRQSPEGPAETLPFTSQQPQRWPLIYFVLAPVLLAAGILFLDQKSPDVVVAPLASMILMLLLSFRLEPLELIPFAATFAGVIFYSLRYMQHLDQQGDSDWMRLSVRIFSFLVASSLAVLFSKYRREARARHDRTVAIITTMPVPVIISDATSLIVFANDEAVEFMQMPRGHLQCASYVQLFMANKDEGTAMRDYIKFFTNLPDVEEGTLTRTRDMCLAIANGEKHNVQARLICLGKGEARSMITVLKLW